MTIIPFQPSNVGPFQFQPVLDDVQYNAVVGWNFVGERYYISLFTLSGERVFNLPVIGSVDGVPIEAIAWAHGFVNVQTTRNHGYLRGSTIDLVVRGNVPFGYNGIFRSLVTGFDTFQYPLAANPGESSQFGLSNYDINIAAGYFKDSRLVFRESSQQFEVTP